jgi:hypothetical protein
MNGCRAGASSAASAEPQSSGRRFWLLFGKTKAQESEIAGHRLSKRLVLPKSSDE